MSSSSNIGVCPNCGAALSQATRGLCPRCMVVGGVGVDFFSAEKSEVLADGDLPSVEELSMLLEDIEIEELIGRGGMGAVFKGRQVGLDRVVAVKVLRLDQAGNPEFAERFRVEARALAKLSHPNIVAVYDYGELEGFVYFVMEYVEGTDLAVLIEGGDLEPRQTLELIVQICQGLQFAHDCGVIHRDIKPANILVDGAGNVKVADFGLARFSEMEDARLTTGGDRLGTPLYMAPEQREGDVVDRRADIFSLGVVFYEMLTGQLPSGSVAVPSKRAAMAVSSQVDRVVMRAMEPEPGRRFQQVREVADSLRKIGARRPVMMLLGVIGVLLVAALGYVLLPVDSEEGDVRADLPGLLFESQRWDDKAHWRRVEIGKGIVVLPDVGLKWEHGGQEWGFASLRGKDRFAIPDDGALLFEWEISDYGVAGDDQLRYIVEFGVVGGGADPRDMLRQFHSYSQVEPSVYIVLHPRADPQNIQMQLAYKDGSGVGEHARGQHGVAVDESGISLPRAVLEGDENHTFWLRIGQDGAEAGWSGGEGTSKFTWEQTTFSPQVIRSLGESVWAITTGKNSGEEFSGTHVLRRFSVRREVE